MRKIYIIILGVILVVGAGILFLFVRMGSNDSRSIADFSSAYQSYDQAVSATSNSILTDPTHAAIKEQNADVALSALKTIASARISSLTKNDGVLMQVMGQIADLSTKELDALKAYQQAAANQSADLATFASQLRDLTGQRQGAYARFLGLSG